MWTCLKAGLLSRLDFFRSRRNYIAPEETPPSSGRTTTCRPVPPVQGRPGDGRERRIKLLFFAVFGLRGVLQSVAPFPAVVQIAAMYPVYLILTLMDLTKSTAERWSRTTSASTRSTRLGLLPRLFISTLPRTLHRRHHVFPGVVAVDLPAERAVVQVRTLSRARQGLRALYRGGSPEMASNATLSRHRPRPPPRSPSPSTPRWNRIQLEQQAPALRPATFKGPGNRSGCEGCSPMPSPSRRRARRRHRRSMMRVSDAQ